MKKSMKIVVGAALTLAMSLSLVSCNKKKSGYTEGVLSYLRCSETEFKEGYAETERLVALLNDEGYLTKYSEKMKSHKHAEADVKYYDTLDALLMALKSGEIDQITAIPQTTAAYLCARDPEIETLYEFDYRKMRGSEKYSFPWMSFSVLGEGFSFMLLDKNAELKDQLNGAIATLEKNGKMQELISDYIFEPMKGAEPKVVALENKPGRKTVKVAVTGDFPAMDYVAAGGQSAGFNTALLSEIGKLLDFNVEIIQVNSVGRAAALASGTADVAFWTRSTVAPESVRSHLEDLESNVRAEKRANIDKNFSDKEKDAFASFVSSVNSAFASGAVQPAPLSIAKIDMPDGTIITDSYFVDAKVSVVLKK